MNYSKINFFDTVNGPGVRVSLFVSGCTLNCKGCFNKESQDFKFGKLFDEQAKQSILEGLKRYGKYCSGLSILGGEPFEPKNVPALFDLLSFLKQQLPDLNIWCWTGNKVEELKDEQALKLLALIDVVVDGPFIEDLKCDSLFHGSSNQRVLHQLRKVTV